MQMIHRIRWSIRTHDRVCLLKTAGPEGFMIRSIK